MAPQHPSPSICEPEARHGRASGSQKSPYWKFAVAGVLVLLAIAASARLVRSEAVERVSEGVPPTSVANTASTSTPPATLGERRVIPTPVSIPTGVTPMPWPSGTAVATSVPMPGPTPVAPGASRWEIIDSRLVAIDTTGAWTAESSPQLGVPYGPPDGLMVGRCTTVGENPIVAVTREASSGRHVLATFDVTGQTWTRRGDLPSSPLDDGSPYTDNCAALVVDDVLIVATSAVDELFFLISNDGGGTFRTRTMQYPTDWPGMESITDIEVFNVLRHQNELVISVCTWYSYDVSCAEHVLRIDISAVLGAHSTTFTWSDAGGSVVHPSEQYAGSYLDLFSGAGLDNDAIAVVQLGDQVWRMERYNTVVESYLDYSYEQGSWAAAPLDESPVAFPRGLQPQLFQYGDTAIAAVPLANVPFDALPVRWYTTVDWWMYDRDDATWTAIGAPPAMSIPLWQFADRPVSAGSLFDDDRDGMLVIPAEPLTSWNDVVEENHPPTIAGESIYSFGNGTVWISQDRGRQWEPSQSLSRNNYGRDRCASRVEDTLAFTVLEGVWASELIVNTPTEQRVVPIPRRPQPLRSGAAPISPCRPLRLGNSWHVAHIESGGDSLVVQSIADNDSITERTISLRGAWSDAIPSDRVYRGSVDLYRDGDRIIVHICTIDAGAQCSFTDFSFSRSLLEDSQLSFSAAAESETRPARFSPPNLHHYGPADALFQLGDELWRADHAEIAGECVCGEGGDLAPYYTWVGGPFDGESETPQTRTVDFLLFNGRVTRCGSDEIPTSAQVRNEPGFVQPDPEQHCEALDDDGFWEPVFGPIAVDWATVPVGVAVQFIERDERGRIMVTPVGG